MIPIWFIIGATVLIYGIAITVTGIVRWSHPAAGVEMARLHPDVWWGLFMVLFGLFYGARYRPGGPRS